MNGRFKEIPPDQIPDNPVKLIGSDWMLITAGTPESFNTMTASWGGLGVLWDKPVVFCFVRPTRYTYEFMEKSAAFTLSFLPRDYRRVLEFCGSHSGRHVDKIARCGITPVKGALDTVHFAEARLVIECRKLYYQDINPGAFLAQTLTDVYPERDYHRMYVGEMVRVLSV
jgi:flavin reductase (DIM6/NTAB) family NADH-FMN oxidoreductase RutF